MWVRAWAVGLWVAVGLALPDEPLNPMRMVQRADSLADAGRHSDAVGLYMQALQTRAVPRPEVGGWRVQGAAPGARASDV
jgi:hypothetical protein